MATIRKRGNKYQVQIRRKEYPDISNTFHRRNEAQEWARLMEVQADRGELAPDRGMLEQITLGSMVVRYRDEMVSKKKCADNETIILNAFLKNPICQQRLSDLTTADFATYRNEKLKTIKAKSVKRLLSPIQNMFEIARDEWGIPIKENPLAKLKLKGADDRRERRLKEGEYQKLIQAAETRKNPWIKKVIIFAIQTGMRRGEILSLQWGQVDLSRRSVTILEAKNGYSRTVPITPKAIDLLKEIREIQKGISNGISTSSDTSSEEIISLNLNDNCISDSSKVFPVTPNALRLNWGRMLKDTGIRDLHFHDLRHEAISRFFEMGLTVPEVASISGHRDMRMLMRYAHSRSSEVLRKLDG